MYHMRVIYFYKTLMYKFSFLSKQKTKLNTKVLKV